MLGIIKQGLRDFSISRTSISWGIPLPWDAQHVAYVWFDALVNYCTAVGYGTDRERFDRFWPVDYHLIGKDILRQHAVYWPAMLMSAGEAPPKHVFAHGYLLVGGEKMSKSKLNQIAPADLVADFGVDGFRYHFLADQRFGPDGDFSYEAMVARYNADLANNFGNLANRVLNMAVNYCDGVVPELRADGPLVDAVATAFEAQTAAFERLDIASAFGAVWDLIRAANAYIEDSKPWALNKAGDAAATVGGDRRLPRGAARGRAPRVAGDPACLGRALEPPRPLRRTDRPAPARCGGVGRADAGCDAREGRAPLPADRPVTWFDSHCHLQMLDVPVGVALARGRAAGVDGMVCVGTDLESSGAAVEVATREPDVWAAVGLHPHDAADRTGGVAGPRGAEHRRPGRGDRRDRSRLLLRTQPAGGTDRELPRPHPARART